MHSPYVRVKICGITTPEDAKMIADLGADAIGLNFYAKSSRYVTVETSRKIVRAVPPFLSLTGVFVDTDPAEIVGIAREIGLGTVQTYDGAALHNDFFPAAHIPAFRVRSQDDIEFIRDYAASSSIQPRAILVDSFVQGEMGGTGQIAPWDLIADLISPKAGEPLSIPVILAGGLTPDNVGEAIRLVRPWGVDVAGGVESAPGVKEFGKVRAFIAAVREASAKLK